VQVASQHAEAVGERSGIGMEKRFLLDGVTLNASDVSPGHVEFAAAIEAHLADADLSIRDGTAVAAGETAYAIALDGLVEFALADVLIQNFSEGRQRIPLPLF